MNAYERVMSDMIVQAMVVYLTMSMVKHLKQHLKRLEEEDGLG